MLLPLMQFLKSIGSYDRVRGELDGRIQKPPKEYIHRGLSTDNTIDDLYHRKPCLLVHRHYFDTLCLHVSHYNPAL